jgi:hypothetical protein
VGGFVPGIKLQGLAQGGQRFIGLAGVGQGVGEVIVGFDRASTAIAFP